MVAGGVLLGVVASSTGGPVARIAHAGSIGLQLFGLLLTLLGVGAVRESLVQAPDAIGRATGRAAGKIVGWLSQRWSAPWSYLRRLARRPPVVHNAAAHLISRTTLTATAAERRSVPDRAVVTEQRWLEVLDDQMTYVYERLDELKRGRIEDRQLHHGLVDAQGDEFRTQIRNGSGCVIFGLLFSIAGTALGFCS